MLLWFNTPNIWHTFSSASIETVFEVSRALWYSSCLSWLMYVLVLRNDNFGLISMFSVAAIVNSPYCKLKDYTTTFLLDDSVTVFLNSTAICSKQLDKIEDQGERSSLRDPVFYCINVKIIQFRFLLLFLFLLHEKLELKTIFVKIVVMKIAGWRIATAAWLKYC